MTGMPDRVVEGAEQLRGSGISYALKYLGYIPVKVPASEMTSDVRVMLLKHSLLTLTALRDKREPPAVTSFMDMMTGAPSLVNLTVVFNISSTAITTSHDDDKQPEKMGRLLLRHPIRNTAIAEQIDECRDCFAYISKKKDGSDRRCCVFSSETPALIRTIMDDLEDAIYLSIKDDEKARDKSASQPDPTTGQPRPKPRGTTSPSALSPRALELSQYKWYHGVMSRPQAKEKLKQPGDFLIRESPNQKNQVILSGLCTQGEEKHILLMDEKGRIKTDDSEFSSVAEMVTFYMDSQSEISMENVPSMRLIRPIERSS